MYLAMYSIEGASSQVNLNDWASTRDFSIKTRASAVNPANAINKWSSSFAIFLIVRASCKLATALRSTPNTTQSLPRKPTTALPLCEI